MNSHPPLSIVIPVFNEAKNLPELIERCQAVCLNMLNPYEIILVDDGSQDNSAEIINQAADSKDSHIIGVILNRNYGQHAAVMAGFSKACGDIIVTLDADLQNPPEEIPKLVAESEKGYDVVGSIRVSRHDSWFRKSASWLINKMVQKSTGVMMHDYGCMLRAYQRPIIQALLTCHERSTFIPVLANSFAKSTCEIQVRHQPRAFGQSKYQFWKLINLQFDLLTSMTTFPLRMLSILGAMASMIGIGLSLFIIIMRLVYGSQWAVNGVFTLFAVLFIFIGGQFIGLGLLGEYIGRIFQDVRARPRYFIQTVIGNSQIGAKERIKS